MRLLATADLHYNHPRSRDLTVEFARQINALEFDALLLVGDTASSAGDSLEQCLSLFTFAGPKLFVCGNHELWTHEADSHFLFTDVLPTRVRNAGWHWLEGDPFVAGETAIVGTVGWYDYSFAPEHLGIPRRFYEAKVSPGAAERLSEYAALIEGHDDVTEAHREIVARWNDSRYAKLHRSDPQFLAELLEGLRQSLEKVKSAKQIIAAVHHLPFREMLPPRRNATWDFAWAYLGAQAIGDELLRHPQITHVLCGHSHLPMERRIGHLQAINIGSGYRHKQYVVVDC